LDEQLIRHERCSAEEVIASRNGLKNHLCEKTLRAGRLAMYARNVSRDLPFLRIGKPPGRRHHCISWHVALLSRLHATMDIRKSLKPTIFTGGHKEPDRRPLQATPETLLPLS
jgi:hypothetical protein